MLHDAIVSGALLPGERLPIEDLAAATGMSPMPIREALRRLDGVGLVENVPHRGARVADLSVEDLNEVYDSRLMLEVPAIGRAAENFSDEDAANALGVARAPRLGDQTRKRRRVAASPHRLPLRPLPRRLLALAGPPDLAALGQRRALPRRHRRHPPALPVPRRRAREAARGLPRAPARGRRNPPLEPPGPHGQPDRDGHGRHRAVRAERDPESSVRDQVASGAVGAGVRGTLLSRSVGVWSIRLSPLSSSGPQSQNVRRVPDPHLGSGLARQLPSLGS